MLTVDVEKAESPDYKAPSVTVERHEMVGPMGGEVVRRWVFSYDSEDVTMKTTFPEENNLYLEESTIHGGYVGERPLNGTVPDDVKEMLKVGGFCKRVVNETDLDDRQATLTEE